MYSGFNKTTWNSLVQNVCNLKISSITGIRYITNDGKRPLIERAFWIAAIISMGILAIWQGHQLYTRYSKRPAIITVDNSYYDWKLTFPSATICFDDLKPKKELRQAIKILIQKHNLSKSLLSEEYEDFVGYLHDLAFLNYTNYYKYEAYARGSKKEFLQPSQYLEVLDMVVPNLNLLQSSGIVTFPLYKKRPLYRVFTEFGPCVVANPNHYVYNPIKYTFYELASMVIKANNITGKAYIYFHDPNEVMDILDRKTVIESGYYWQFKYVVDIVTMGKDVEHLSVQQKKCRLPYEPRQKPLKHSPVYSHNLCGFEKRIRIALKYCKCSPYYYRRLAGEPICNLTGLYCLSKYEGKLTFNGNSTQKYPCPQNCEVAIYGEWYVVVKDPFIETTFEMNVIFPKIIYVRSLVFSKTILTVQIGGIFALFLGCSLLSFIEAFYSLIVRAIFKILER